METHESKYVMNERQQSRPSSVTIIFVTAFVRLKRLITSSNIVLRTFFILIKSYRKLLYNYREASFSQVSTENYRQINSNYQNTIFQTYVCLLEIPRSLKYNIMYAIPRNSFKYIFINFFFNTVIKKCLFTVNIFSNNIELYPIFIQLLTLKQIFQLHQIWSCLCENSRNFVHKYYVSIYFVKIY